MQAKISCFAWTLPHRIVLVVGELAVSVMTSQEHLFSAHSLASEARGAAARSSSCHRPTAGTSAGSDCDFDPETPIGKPGWHRLSAGLTACRQPDLPRLPPPARRRSSSRDAAGAAPDAHQLRPAPPADTAATGRAMH